jgi:hypothetical protein
VSSLAVALSVGAINVNSQATNSAIAVGENLLSGWSSHRKTNNGFGLQVGIFANTANYNIIVDNDISDGNIFDPDIMPAVQVQTL